MEYQQIGTDSVSVLFSSQQHRLYTKIQHLLLFSNLHFAVLPIIRVGNQYLNSYYSVSKSIATSKPEYLTLSSRGSRILCLKLSFYGPVTFNPKYLLAWDFNPNSLIKRDQQFRVGTTVTANATIGTLLLQIDGGIIVQKYLDDKEWVSVRRNRLLGYSEDVRVEGEGMTKEWVRMKGAGYVWICSQDIEQFQKLNKLAIIGAVILVGLILLAMF